MRSETEMYSLIMNTAKADERIRAVILNGSRANPAVQKDPFQDYDIVFLVNNLLPYKSEDIFTIFGDILVMERTDENTLFDECFEDFVCYLMQFTDGNRIDLTIALVKDWERYCLDDRLTAVLLDKDGFIPKLKEPNDSTHHIKRPTLRKFEECRTEFWWTSLYVSKGLWRGQLLYAQNHMEICVRKMLLQMMSWLAGSENDFSVSVGKCGDDLKNYISQEIWEEYLLTYSACNKEEIWMALIKACDLFKMVTEMVSESLGFIYNKEIEKNTLEFISYTKDLPENAKAIDFSL